MIGGVPGRWSSNPFGFWTGKLRRGKGTSSSRTELEAEVEPDHVPRHLGPVTPAAPCYGALSLSNRAQDARAGWRGRWGPCRVWAHLKNRLDAKPRSSCSTTSPVNKAVNCLWPQAPEAQAFALGKAPQPTQLVLLGRASDPPVITVRPPNPLLPALC